MSNFSSTSYILFRRVAAFLYDCLLLLAIYFVVTAVAISFNNGHAVHHFAYKFLLYVISFLFFDWFWMRGGQTLGMRAWKIKLSSTSDASLTHVQCLQHYLLGSLFFVITLFWMLFDKDGRALHDRLSNTKISNYIK
ncbi:MAG: RDD family protein [Granulosicoccaceae bacterium]